MGGKITAMAAGVDDRIKASATLMPKGQNASFGVGDGLEGVLSAISATFAHGKFDASIGVCAEREA